MIEITDEIKEFFISCGIQALYQKRIQEYRLTRSADFVKSIESETNEYGVMKNCKFICKKCYNSIRPKYRKISNNKAVIKKSNPQMIHILLLIKMRGGQKIKLKDIYNLLVLMI